jgi:hypothetical protein
MAVIRRDRLAAQLAALVGLIRSRWKGLSGGEEVWRDIARFFDELGQKAIRVSRQQASAPAAAAVGGGLEAT